MMMSSIKFVRINAQRANSSLVVARSVVSNRNLLDEFGRSSSSRSSSRNDPRGTNPDHPPRGRRHLSSNSARRKGRSRKNTATASTSAAKDDPKKKIFFRSLGCPRNFVDTEVMLGFAVSSSEDRSDGGDMEPTHDPSEADVVVINTCGFLESARNESRAAIARAQEVIREREETTRRRRGGGRGSGSGSGSEPSGLGKRSKLVVTGCMVNLPAQQDRIRRDFPGVDAVLPSGNIDSIVETIRALEKDTSDENNDKKQRNKKKKKKKNQKNSNSRKPNDDDPATVNVTTTTTTPPSAAASASNLSSRVQRKSFLEKGETPRFLATPPHYAYLKIAEGCRKRCSFCVIPKLKGRLQSKPVRQVVEEFRAIVEHGTAREVILIAQDLGDYGLDFSSSSSSSSAAVVADSNNTKQPTKRKKQAATTATRNANANANANANDRGSTSRGDDPVEEQRTTPKSHLTVLLEEILASMDDDVEGCNKETTIGSEHNDDNNNNNDSNDDDPFWLRLLYLYPDEITPDLIDLMERDRRIARYVDLPIQHSHDDMLRAMRRKTDSKHIETTIRTLRERLPDICIRTSLMVGFPGETEDHFEDLLRFVRDAKLDHVGVFVYSNEEMAHSSRLDGQVPEDVKRDRYRRLMEEQWKVVEARHKERVNESERLRVVVEGLEEIEGDRESDNGYDNGDESSERATLRIVGRHAGQCPEIDGQVILEGEPRVYPGERYWVEVTGYEGYDLVGRVIRDEDQ